MSEPDDTRPCPGCGTPVAARPAGRPDLERGSCSCCGLQLVADDGEPWREIRG